MRTVLAVGVWLCMITTTYSSEPTGATWQAMSDSKRSSTAANIGRALAREYPDIDPMLTAIKIKECLTKATTGGGYDRAELSTLASICHNIGEVR